MKIELSLSLEYVSEWNAWDGVRELVSNARDAEVLLNAKMTVRHSGDRLLIENDGAVLPHEALLLGYTTKRDQPAAIGRHAEGLKLGVLALLRAGHAVKIRSGSEVWTPSIGRSEKFKADVLKFDIATGRQERPRVSVEIGGVDKVTWDLMKARFLFLAKLKDDEVVETSHGRLLISDCYRGDVFLKGIWVQHRGTSCFGYDFVDATIDRDRKMLASWDIEWKAAQIWEEACARRQDLIDKFLGLVEKNDDDVRSVKYIASPAAAILDAAAARFAKRHGDKAVPVANLGESRDVEHLGRKGVVVSESLGALLAKKLGTIDDIRKGLASEVVTTFSWGELTPDERDALSWAVETLGKVRTGISFDQVDVVEFRSATMLGQYRDGRWLLARKDLAQPEETLATLIHEYCHHVGGDGEVGHVRAIENCWRDIVALLRKGGS